MTTLFDAGDLDRIDREKRLVEQAPRQLPVEDRSPEEDNMFIEIEEPDRQSAITDEMLDAFFVALKERL